MTGPAHAMARTAACMQIVADTGGGIPAVASLAADAVFPPDAGTVKAGTNAPGTPRRKRRHGKGSGVRLAGFLGAGVLPAAGRYAGGGGGGDCVLLYPGKGFYAIGDAADRDPSLAYRIMKRFCALLDGIPGVCAQRVCDAGDVEAIRGRLLAAVDALLHGLTFGSGCTFTGILCLAVPDGHAGLLLHTGDSALYHWTGVEGDARCLTKPNFWLLGRTERFFQVEQIFLPAGSRLLLATDGACAMLASGGRSAEAVAAELFRTRTIEDVPGGLFALGREHGRNSDDAAALAVVPGNGDAA